MSFIRGFVQSTFEQHCVSTLYRHVMSWRVISHCARETFAPSILIRVGNMMDVNEALMRRGKLTPVKRKRAAASKKVPSRPTGSMTLMRFSRPLDELSFPTQAPNANRPSSPLRSQIAAPSEACYSSPQATVPTMQAYIDLGQKDFGRHTTCSKCGLLYTVGEEADEKEHRRFCSTVSRGITMSKWKNERLVRAFPDDDARIIEIRSGDAPLHIKKLMEVKELLDDALGVVDADAFLPRGHFLFVKGRQIVGCVNVERIEHGFTLDPKDATTLNPDARAPAVIGVCQLWVHPDHRHKRIATRLIDAVRSKFVYGLVVPKTRVAFGQPTRNGLAFATQYMTPHAVLVYDTPSH
ncbi:hypothetical protein PINS_up008379 [Pythium insidiosum]|nr:hypothetical protein PINS_up008379 [Pythium insidiosum]